MHWRRKWQPTPVFLPGESQGRGSLEGYSPWSHKEPDMNEHAYVHLQIQSHSEVLGLRSSTYEFWEDAVQLTTLSFPLLLVLGKYVYFPSCRL